MGFPTAFLPLVLPGADEIPTSPPDEEVVAGWTAFGLFLLLAVAVGLLGWSLVRQLKKVRRAQEAGVYGEDEIPRRDEADTDRPSEASSDPQEDSSSGGDPGRDVDQRP